MNPYTMAFAIGYYYGRAYGYTENVSIPEQDSCHVSNQGFTDGLAAGRRDFQDVDLPLIALSQPQVDPE